MMLSAKCQGQAGAKGCCITSSQGQSQASPVSTYMPAQHDSLSLVVSMVQMLPCGKAGGEPQLVQPCPD